MTHTGDWVVARRGDASPGAAFDAPCYRIPALTRTPSGRLVIAHDVRRDHLDLPGEFDIVTRCSDDDGHTWGEPSLLRRHEAGWGCGDASLLVDPDTRTVLCFYAASAGPSFWDDAGLELWLARSRDDARTWTHERVQFGAVAGFEIGAMFASSGNGVALRSGRLLQPMVVRPAGTTDRHAVIAISDDHGASWRLGDTVLGCDETKVTELADGRVLLHGRDAPRRRQAISTNEGESFTTADPHPDLPDPSCNGGLATMVDGSLAVTLPTPSTAPIDANLDPTRGQGAVLAWGRRENLVVRRSVDGGRTWQVGETLDEGPAAYSVCCALPNGGLLVVWERGPYDALVARVLDPVTP